MDTDLWYMARLCFCLHIGLGATATRPICGKNKDSPCTKGQYPCFIYIFTFFTPMIEIHVEMVITLRKKTSL